MATRRPVRQIEVLIICSQNLQDSAGGVVSHVTVLAEQLAALRKPDRRDLHQCRVDLLTPRGSRSKQNNLRHFGARSESGLVRLGEPLFQSAFEACAKHWHGNGRRRAHWDIVHAHDTDGLLLGMLLKVGMQSTGRAPKLIYTVHRVPDGVPSTAAVNVKEAHLRLLENVDLVDAYIAPSDYCARKLATYLGSDPAKITVLNHGVPTGRVSPVAAAHATIPKLKGRGPIVFCPARVDANKGADVLLAASEEVLQHCSGAQFVFAGALKDVGDASFAQKIRDHLLRHTRAKQIFFGTDAGASFSEAEMQTFYDAATVCVLPSHHENFPLALLEAGSFGKAVVASDVGGIPEIITDSGTGLLVPAGKPQDLAQQIVRLLRDSATRKQYGDALRARVENSFSATRMAARYLDLYERVGRVRLR